MSKIILIYKLTNCILTKHVQIIQIHKQTQNYINVDYAYRINIVKHVRGTKAT